MLNKKLFKKLNEQMELNNVISQEITLEERKTAEEKIIFEDINNERIANLNIKDED